jgi:5-methylthioribose kinase
MIALRKRIRQSEICDGEIAFLFKVVRTDDNREKLEHYFVKRQGDRLYRVSGDKLGEPIEKTEIKDSILIMAQSTPEGSLYRARMDRLKPRKTVLIPMF